MLSQPRCRPLWVPFVLGCGLAAICADFSRYHERHNADTLIPVMVSLYQWEPFYWGQNRLGMLLATLAAPVSHPLANLLFQTFLSIFGSLVAIGLFARYLLRDSTWAVIGGASAAVFLLAMPDFDLFFALNGAQPYLLSLTLALPAIAVAFEGRSRPILRLVVALALTAVAYWYNSGLGLLIAPLALCRFLVSPWLGPLLAEQPGQSLTLRVWRSPAVRELAGTAGLTLFGTVFAWLLMKLHADMGNEYSFVTPAEWLEGCRRLKWGVGVRFPDYLDVVAVVAGTGLFWLLVPTTRAAAFRGLLVFATAVVWLLVQLLIAGATAWVKGNAYDIRYLYAGIAALAPGAVSMWILPLLAVVPTASRWAAWGSAAVIPIAAVTAYGVPSSTAPREALDQVAGHWTGDLLDGRCTHVVGDYWQVWPAVLHANMTLADRDDPRILWGVTIRAASTQPKWSQTPPGETRLGWLLTPGCPEPAAESEPSWRWAYAHTMLVERRATVVVHVPVVPDPHSPK